MIKYCSDTRVDNSNVFQKVKTLREHLKKYLMKILRLIEVHVKITSSLTYEKVYI